MKNEKDDLISQVESGENPFIATEEDLKKIAGDGNFIPTVPEKTSEKETALIIPSKPIDVEGQTKRETDFEYVRANIYTITKKSIKALEHLSEIADQSRHPRAYEVLSTLVKTIADAQKDLIAIHKEKEKMDADSTEQNTPGVVNNNLFVGTTTELDEIVKKMITFKKQDDSV